MQLIFQKAPIGLVPGCEEAREWLQKKKMGATILVEPKELRNPGFHKKFFALMQLGFDYWSESVSETLEYKGQQILPNFERFRKDVTILAGYFTPVVNLKGETRLEAESISWSKMNEERFEKLYSATINVLLRMVFNGRISRQMTEKELRDVASQIVDFG